MAVKYNDENVKQLLALCASSITIIVKQMDKMDSLLPHPDDKIEWAHYHNELRKNARKLCEMYLDEIPDSPYPAIIIDHSEEES